MMKSFLADFVFGMIALPLATIAAVGVSYVLIITVFGPLLWLPVFYILVLIWVLRPAFRGNYGRLAALAVWLIAWAVYAGSQAITAQIKAYEVANANTRLPVRSGIDAVAFRTETCDAICKELLTRRLVKTVFLMGRSKSHVLTLSSAEPCDDALASNLRESHRSYLCVRDDAAYGISGQALLFEKGAQLSRDFWGEREVVTLTVSEWDNNKWRPIYERRFGRVDVLQYLPAFIGFFTGGGQRRIEWWHRTINIGENVTLKEIIGQVLGVELVGSVDGTVVQPFGNGSTIAATTCSNQPCRPATPLRPIV
jgi:hypothetical protein